MKRASLYLLGIPLAAFLACEEEQPVPDNALDRQAPEINLIAPMQGLEYYPYQSIPVVATITDETDLEEVIIYFSGPGNYKNSYNRIDGKNEVEFVEGKVDHVDFTFSLAESILPGSYQIVIQAIDKEGNQNEQSANFSILEKDLEKPSINFQNPTAMEAFFPAQTLEVAADVTDNQQLKKIRLLLAKEGDLALLDQSYTTIPNGLSHEVKESFVIPENAPSGEYFLTVEAEDYSGNVETKAIVISIEPISDSTK